MANDFFQRKKIDVGVHLNDVQKQAVMQTEGPLLLLASPGSGKTTTLIMRIGYLIEEKGVSPSRLKAITFSRAAAADMRERFKSFFPELQPISFSTIHSFAFAVVRDYFQQKGLAFHIIEGQASTQMNIPNKQQVLRTLYESTVGEVMTEDQMEELTTYISYVKNKLLPEERWTSVQCDVPKAAEILHRYEVYKRTARTSVLLDFDDMLTYCNDILSREEAVLQRYQRKYDYVLTDESQDTSLVQHKILEKLVREHQNLCVVADDDQSIYSWRGAEPAYLLNFKKVYPEATTLFMEQNYRSSFDIVQVANQFIQHNKRRYRKNMFTKNARSEPIHIQWSAEAVSQARYVVAQVKESENPAEVAVLYRNHSSAIILINEFDKAGLPFYLKDADNRFFSHWVVKDVLNFMRMAYTERRLDIFEKIYMKMNGYISKEQMNRLINRQENRSLFASLLAHGQLKDYQVKHIKRNQTLFRKMRVETPQQALTTIRDKLGYEKALVRMSERLGFRLEHLLWVLDTLEQIADGLDTLVDFAERLAHLEEVMQRAKGRKAEQAVTFSTFHSAKGLEFQHVYMIDLIEGFIPSAHDEKDDALMEEARRLFYVGMTRAKERLTLLTYGMRKRDRVKESRFVNDVRTIMRSRKRATHVKRQRDKRRSEQRTRVKRESMSNPDAIRTREQLTVGKTVKHRVFGRGTINNMDEETIHIQFIREEKRLSIDTCLERGLLE